MPQYFGGPTRQNNDDFEVVLEYLREQEEVEKSIKALLFDEQMNVLSEACINDGEWNPTSPNVRIGSGEES